MAYKNVFSIALLVLLLTSCGGFLGLLKKGKLTHMNDVEQLKFDLDRNLMYVSVEIHGKKRRFIIDSGAPNVIDKSIQEELGLKTVYSTGIKDISDRSNRLDFVLIDELKLGNITVENTAAVVTDFSIFNCAGIDGIIGTNIMSHFDWRIDYNNEVAYLYRKGIPSTETDSFNGPIPLTFTPQKSPYFQLSFQEDQKFKTLIDMGSTGSLNIKRWTEFSTADSNVTWMYGQTSKGIYGALMDTVYFGVQEGVEINNISLPPLLYRTHKRSSTSVGNKLLRHFDVIISWKNKQLFLRPISAPDTLPQLKELYITYEEEKVIVRNLSENSPWHAEGIQVGDEIQAINGRNTHTLTSDEYCLEREKWKKGAELLVKTAGDSLKRIHVNELGF